MSALDDHIGIASTTIKTKMATKQLCQNDLRGQLEGAEYDDITARTLAAVLDLIPSFPAKGMNSSPQRMPGWTPRGHCVCIVQGPF